MLLPCRRCPSEFTLDCKRCEAIVNIIRDDAKDTRVSDLQMFVVSLISDKFEQISIPDQFIDMLVNGFVGHPAFQDYVEVRNAGVFGIITDYVHYGFTSLAIQSKFRRTISAWQEHSRMARKAFSL